MNGICVKELYIKDKIEKQSTCSFYMWQAQSSRFEGTSIKSPGLCGALVARKIKNNFRRNFTCVYCVLIQPSRWNVCCCTVLVNIPVKSVNSKHSAKGAHSKRSSQVHTDYIVLFEWKFSN